MTITAEDAYAALERAVALKGDGYVYTNPYGERARPTSDDAPAAQCLYVYEDGPGCGVGYALVDLGVSIDDLAKFEDTGALSVAAMLGATFHAAHVLDAFQSKQDRGATWGEALVKAKEVLVTGLPRPFALVDGP